MVQKTNCWFLPIGMLLALIFSVILDMVQRSRVRYSLFWKIYFVEHWKHKETLVNLFNSTDEHLLNNKHRLLANIPSEIPATRLCPLFARSIISSGTVPLTNHCYLSFLPKTQLKFTHSGKCWPCLCMCFPSLYVLPKR